MEQFKLDKEFCLLDTVFNAGTAKYVFVLEYSSLALKSATHLSRPPKVFKSNDLFT